MHLITRFFIIIFLLHNLHCQPADWLFMLTLTVWHSKTLFSMRGLQAYWHQKQTYGKKYVWALNTQFSCSISDPFKCQKAVQGAPVLKMNAPTKSSLLLMAIVVILSCYSLSSEGLGVSHNILQVWERSTIKKNNKIKGCVLCQMQPSIVSFSVNHLSCKCTRN